MPGFALLGLLLLANAERIDAGRAAADSGDAQLADSGQEGSATGEAARAALHPAGSLDAGTLSRLSGRVASKGTRDIVTAASLVVDGVDSAATETGDDGSFTLWLTPGEHRLEVRAPEHQPGIFVEQLKAGESLEVTYRLVRNVLRPYETVVRGVADRAEQARVQLSGPELTEVAGTQGEPLRVIPLLPGVTTPLSGVAYPIVRGASPAATGFFLDDVQVPQLYHLLLGPSVIYPEFIERVDFYSSNAPVRYGRVTAGVVSATTAKPRDDRVHVSGYVDLLNAGAFVEVPIAKTGTHVSAAGRFSYTGLILGWVGKALAQGATPVVEFYDYQLRVEQKLAGVKLRLFAFGSSDLVGSRADDPEDNTGYVTSRFHRADLRALIPWGAGTVEAGLTAGTESQGLLNEREGVRQGSFLMSRFIVAGRLRYRLESGPWQFKAGLDGERQQSTVEVEVANSASPFEVPQSVGTFFGGFAELAWTQGALTAVAGVRADSFLLAPSTHQLSIDPRLELKWQLNSWFQAQAGGGLFHQAPLLLINLPVSDAAALADGLHTVAQFGAGVEAKLPLDLRLQVNGYYNQLLAARERSLTQFVVGVSTLDDRLAASRTGRAYGVELMLRAPARGRLFGWLSYSLMRSERQRRFGVYSLNQTLAGQREALLPFAFDQTHVLNLVVGYQLPKGFKVSATFHVNTGRPESGEFGSRTQRLVKSDDGTFRWQVLPRDEVDRLPTFWRVDVRASKSFLFDTFALELYLDVLNVSAQQEVVAFSYSNQRGSDDGSKVPRVPVKTPNGIPLLYPSLGVKGRW